MYTANKNIYNHNIIYGDLFNCITQRVNDKNIGSSIVVPHVCNNIDLFGAGFAAKIAEKFPIVKENYHMLGKTFLKNNLGYSQFIKVYEDQKYNHQLFVVNMIAQNGIKNPTNHRPLNYAALVKCMINVSQFIISNYSIGTKTEKIEIHAPKFGCGLAGGNWNFVQDLISDIWGKYSVFIYDFKSINYDTNIKK